MKIKEIMTKNPTIVPPSTPLKTIQSIFHRNKFWSIYVGDSERFIGIITRNDFLYRGKGVSPSSTADTIMSKNVLAIDVNSDVDEAIKIIKQKKINGLGVTKNGKPCGIITKADIKKRYNRNAFDSNSDTTLKRNIMTQCDFCGEKIKEIMPWTCNYCHRTFCSDHRLPEYHNCPGLTGYAATRSFKAQASPYSDKKSIKFEFLLPALKSKSADERKKNAILLKDRGYIPHTDAEKSSFHFARQNWDDLVALGTPALEPLIAGLRDTDVNIQIACARSLGILGNPIVIDHLIQKLYDPRTSVRIAVAIALNNLGWVPKNDDEKICLIIAQERWGDLDQFGKKIIDPLSAIYDNGNEDVRFHVISTLCKMHDDRILGILTQAIQDKSKKVKLTALQGLVDLKNPKTAGSLLISLQDPDNACKRLAISGLIQLDTDAVPSLIDALDYRNESDSTDILIKKDIITILGEIQDSRAREPLLKNSRNSKSPVIIKVVQEAIEKIDAHDNALKQKSNLYCVNCFSEFNKNKSLLNIFTSSNVPVCRNCKSNKNYVDGVKKVVLLLDKMDSSYTFENGILTINWFKIKRPIDMNEISIIDATNEDISELVMKVKNDDDAERKRKFKLLPVSVAKELGISQAKINLLKNTFGNVHVVEKDTINRLGE